MITSSNPHRSAVLEWEGEFIDGAPLPLCFLVNVRDAENGFFDLPF